MNCVIVKDLARSFFRNYSDQWGYYLTPLVLPVQCPFYSSLFPSAPDSYKEPQNMRIAVPIQVLNETTLRGKTSDKVCGGI